MPPPIFFSRPPSPARAFLLALVAGAACFAAPAAAVQVVGPESVCDSFVDGTCLILTPKVLNCSDSDVPPPVPPSWPFAGTSDLPPLDVCWLLFNASVNMTAQGSLSCLSPETCQLWVEVNASADGVGALSIGPSSTVRANTISLRASSVYIRAGGVVASSALGLHFGPFPGSVGAGGTYGGTGGQDQCEAVASGGRELEAAWADSEGGGADDGEAGAGPGPGPGRRQLSRSSSSSSSSPSPHPPTPLSALPVRSNRLGIPVTTCCTPGFYYLATNASIGSFSKPEEAWDAALGSGGGGFPGSYGGRSGGRINITASSVVLEGDISADGQSSDELAFSGSGSGGTVVITADTIQPGPGGVGTISAVGGLGLHSSFGGGGGGRIVLRHRTLTIPLNNIDAGGGGFAVPPPSQDIPECWVGSAGTIFIQQTLLGAGVTYNQLRVSDDNNNALAVTPLYLKYSNGTTPGPLPPGPDGNGTVPGNGTVAPPSDDTVGVDALIITGMSSVAAGTMELRRVFSAVTAPRPAVDAEWLSASPPTRPLNLTRLDEIDNGPLRARRALRAAFEEERAAAALADGEDPSLLLPAFASVGLTISRGFLFPVVGPNLTVIAAEVNLGDKGIVDSGDLPLFVLTSNMSMSASSEVFSLGDNTFVADHTIDIDGDLYYDVGPLSSSAHGLFFSSSREVDGTTSPRVEEDPTNSSSSSSFSTSPRRLRIQSLRPHLSVPSLEAIVAIRAGSVIFFGPDADISVNRLILFTDGNITFVGRVETLYSLTFSCSQPVEYRESCLQVHWPADLPKPPSAPTYTFAAAAPSGKIQFATNAKVTPQIGIFCASTVELLFGSVLSATGRGCGSDEGWGAPSSGVGSGGGHAGVGGTSSQEAAGGPAYDFPVAPVYPGSGGGSVQGNGGAGGGYIVLAGQQVVVVDVGSVVSADGEYGNNGGGGSGGSVLIETFRLVGGGLISAGGGDGYQGGGGGSGGMFRLRSAILPVLPRGPVGDNATAAADDDSGGGRAAPLFSQSILGDIAAAFTGTVRLPGGSGSLGGGGGANGSVVAPSCPAGYQLLSSQVRCVPCGAGFYRNASSDAQILCARCVNAPARGVYTETTGTDATCAFVCPPGTLFPTCETPLEQLVSLFGGEAGFGLSIGGVLGFIVVILLVLCRRRIVTAQALRKADGNMMLPRYRSKGVTAGLGKASRDDFSASLAELQGQQGGLAGRRNAGNYGAVTPKPGSRFGIHGGGGDGSSGGGPSSSLSSAGGASSGRLTTAVSVLRGGGSPFKTALPQDVERMRGVASSLGDPLTLSFLLSACALQEADLPRHVHRIYLGGSNTFGASWRMPWEANRRLRRHVRSSPYATLAEAANTILQWPRWGWEEWVYAVLILTAYPLAYVFLRARRRVRAVLLLQLVLAREGSHKFLRGTKAHVLQDGLRLGVSGDYSLAYIDILADSAAAAASSVGGGGGSGSGSGGAGKGSTGKKSAAQKQASAGGVPRPLGAAASSSGPSAQPGAPGTSSPRLPLALLFAGDGTYEKPYHLDANDVLVRCVPSAQGLGRFIDADWLEFVAEFNARARCLTAGALVQTSGPSLSFLAAVNADTDILGGLKVELVRFWPCAQSYVDSAAAAAAAAASAAAAAVAASAASSSSSTMMSSSSSVTGSGRRGNRAPAPTTRERLIRQIVADGLPDGMGAEAAALAIASPTGGRPRGLSSKPAALSPRAQGPSSGAGGGPGSGSDDDEGVRAGANNEDGGGSSRTSSRRSSTVTHSSDNESGSQNQSRRDSVDSSHSHSSTSSRGQSGSHKQRRGTDAIIIASSPGSSAAAASGALLPRSRSRLALASGGADAPGSPISPRGSSSQLVGSSVDQGGRARTTPSVFMPPRAHTTEATLDRFGYGSDSDDDEPTLLGGRKLRVEAGAAETAEEDTDVGGADFGGDDGESVYGGDDDGDMGLSRGGGGGGGSGGGGGGGGGGSASRGRLWWTSMTSLAEDVVSASDMRLGLLLTLHGGGLPSGNGGLSSLSSGSPALSPAPFGSASPQMGALTLPAGGRASHAPVPTGGSASRHGHQGLLAHNADAFEDYEGFQFAISDSGVAVVGGGKGGARSGGGDGGAHVSSSSSSSSSSASRSGVGITPGSSARLFGGGAASMTTSQLGLGSYDGGVSASAAGAGIDTLNAARRAAAFGASSGGDGTKGGSEGPLVTTHTAAYTANGSFVQHDGDPDAVLCCPSEGANALLTVVSDMVTNSNVDIGGDDDAVGRRINLRLPYPGILMKRPRALRELYWSADLGMYPAPIDADGRADDEQDRGWSRGGGGRGGGGGGGRYASSGFGMDTQPLHSDPFAAESDFLRRVISAGQSLFDGSRGRRGGGGRDRGGPRRIWREASVMHDEDRGIFAGGGSSGGNSGGRRGYSSGGGEGHRGTSSSSSFYGSTPGFEMPSRGGRSDSVDSLGSEEGDGFRSGSDEGESDDDGGYKNSRRYNNNSASYRGGPRGGGGGGRSANWQSEDFATPAPPFWLWSGGVTPRNLFDWSEGRHVLSSCLSRFAFLFCRLLRRSAPPVPARRALLLYYLVAGLHILLMLLEVSLTIVLIAQLWCIEPAADIGDVDAEGSGGGGGGGSGAFGPGNLLVVGECSFFALVVYLAAPPLTCLLPSLLGLFAVSLGSARGLRMYAAWNGFSIWSTLVAVTVVLANLTQLGADTLTIPFLLLGIKIFAAQLVPVQLVAIEGARPVRGWRGLFEVRTGPIERARKMEMGSGRRRRR
jgi:hypothetical protein